MSLDCLFCRIARGDIPATFVYQDEDIVAFRDIHPMAPTHILLIPTLHISDVLQLTTAHGLLLGRLFILASTLAKNEGIAEDGFRLITNTGPAAGQTVQHLHFHLLGGRALTWPPG